MNNGATSSLPEFKRYIDGVIFNIFTIRNVVMTCHIKQMNDKCQLSVLVWITKSFEKSSRQRQILSSKEDQQFVNTSRMFNSLIMGTKYKCGKTSSIGEIRDNELTNVTKLMRKVVNSLQEERKAKLIE